MPRDVMYSELPVASVAERLAVMAEVVVPTLGMGPLIRRKRVMGMAERLGLQSNAVRVLARLRDRYGEGPLLLPTPGRLHAVVLGPEAALRILRGTPDPFTPATNEKRRVLGHFEPGVSLISTGPEREVRRAWNEAALEAGRPVHSMADRLVPVVEEEARRLMGAVGRRLDWDDWARGWYAMARRIVLGRGAREDEELTDLLAELRFRGQWVVLPRRERKIAELRARIGVHLARAEPGSLAARVAGLPRGKTAPEDQVAHWLFAFDAAGMAAYRALALLAAHPWVMEEARAEMAEAGGEKRMLPLMRAAFLESLRLWPTTPAILRQAVRDVDWDGAVIPKDTNLLIHAPFLHRDPGLSFADRFTPELWLDEARGVRHVVEGPMTLVPFSGGPGVCPAADLVPMVGSAFLGAILAERTPRLAGRGRLRAERPMPGLLDFFTVAFDLR